MPGTCYRYALETMLDLYAAQATGTVVVGAGCALFGSADNGHLAAVRNQNFPELGDHPVLIHGFPLGKSGEVKDLKFGHAWLEGNGYVLDCGTTEKAHSLVTRQWYYELGRIDPGECHQYSIQEVIQHVLAYGRDGSWNAAPADALRE